MRALPYFKMYLIKTVNILGQLSILKLLFSSVYRAYLRFIVNKLKTLDGVLSIYLKGSMADESFVPGLSDIDLAIIINHQESIGTLKKIKFILDLHRASYLIRFFNILGEVEIFTQKELTSKLSQTYINHFNWRLFWGKDFSLNKEALSRVENISFALFLYNNLPQYTNTLTSESLERRFNNIARKTSINYTFVKQLSYTKNKENLLEAISSQIDSRKESVVFLDKEFIQIPYLANLGSYFHINFDLSKQSKITQFLFQHWHRESDFFISMKQLFLSFQWRGYFLLSHGNIGNTKQKESELYQLYTDICGVFKVNTHIDQNNMEIEELMEAIEKVVYGEN